MSNPSWFSLAEAASTYIGQRLGAHPHFVRATVSFEEKTPTVEIGLVRRQKTVLFNEPFDLTNEQGKRTRFQTRINVVPRVVPMIGDLRRHEPAANIKDNLSLGGDLIQNRFAPNYYGTITLTGSQTDITSKPPRYELKEAPYILGNNHVLAHSDQAPIGSELFTQNSAHFGLLSGFIPLSDTLFQVDVAVGHLQDPASTQLLTIRGIGTVVDIRIPNGNEQIRKTGARTGTTAGQITGRTTIRVDGRNYTGVYVTSRGFGCPGDSGSAVVGNDLRVLGIYSWGEEIDCSQNPLGFFFCLADQRRLRKVLIGRAPDAKQVRSLQSKKDSKN